MNNDGKVHPVVESVPPSVEMENTSIKGNIDRPKPTPLSENEADIVDQVSSKVGALKPKQATTRKARRSPRTPTGPNVFSSPSTPTGGVTIHPSSSFLSVDSSVGPPVNLESLIDLLTKNVDIMHSNVHIQKEFEEMVQELLDLNRDPDLLRIVKSHGWIGTRFREIAGVPFDTHSMLREFSNLYLSKNVVNHPSNISNIYDASKNERALDEIYSFMPDQLLHYLLNAPSPTSAEQQQQQQQMGEGQGERAEGALSPSSRLRRGMTVTGSDDLKQVQSVSFKGACMLADISGFSKFSGDMCAKGVSGLDELREATNGFLGHIVKIVYEFHGDVIAFAGDALICVFLDEDEEDEGDQSYKRFSRTPTNDSNDSNPTNGIRTAHEQQGVPPVVPIPLGPSPATSVSKPPKVNSCYRAIQCAHVLKEYKTASLSAHIGVSYGDMKMAMLGGHNDRFVYLLNGSCVSQLSGCIETAGSQQVATTLSCYEEAMKVSFEDQKQEEEVLGSSYYTPPTQLMRSVTQTQGRINTIEIENENEIDEADDENADRRSQEKKKLIRMHYPEVSSSKGHATAGSPGAKTNGDIVLIDYINPRILHSRTPKHRTDPSSGKTIKENRFDRFKALEEDRMKLTDACVQFVPRPVLAAIYSEALDHFGELRMVTTMFISLDSYSPELNQDPATLQPFFLMAQQVLDESGGFLRQFLVDDKGCVFIAMWGMPSYTHSNNCSRAVFCGASISRNVGALGHKCSIGISTGNVFCGNVGSSHRRDYAGIGTDVNMAARYMAKAHGRVLVDNKTFNNLNAKTRRLFKPAEEMKLKGSALPVTPWEYNADDIPVIDTGDEHHDTHVILRKPVKLLLHAQIDKIANTAPTLSKGKGKQVYFTLVLGPPGTGKSTAVGYFRHSARKRHVPCIVIQARPGHEGVPYGLMRQLFLELVGEDNFLTDDMQRSLIQDLVEQIYHDRSDELKESAALSLQVVLGCEWSKARRQGVLASKKSTASLAESAANKGGGGGGGGGAVAATPAAAPEDMSASEYDESGFGWDDDGNKTPPPEGDFSRASVATDGTSTKSRRPGDLVFYRALCFLMKNRRMVIIIEDAHFCDEMSWNELNLILHGREMHACVLMTMRSNLDKEAPDAGSASQEPAAKMVTAVSSKAMTTGTSNSMRRGSKGEDSVHSVHSLQSHDSDKSSTPRSLSRIRGSTNDKQDGEEPAVLFESVKSDGKGLASILAVSPRNSSSSGIDRANSSPKHRRDSKLSTAIQASVRAASSNIETVNEHGNGSVSGRYDDAAAVGVAGLSQRARANSGDLDEGTHRYGLNQASIPAFMSILRCERVAVIEMTGLNQQEVQEVLLRTLQVSHVSQTLVHMVLETSSGNAYWCKAIAQFIKERGVKELEEMMAKGDGQTNALKSLILMRLEKLDLDHQTVLKNAAIIGDEFSQQMLYSVLPRRIQATLSDAVDVLAEHGFIHCVTEYPEAIFGFQNEIIRGTIYELIPPRDAAQIHLAVAEFIEKEYADTLRPFYPLLSFHYSKSSGKRASTFMYKVKAGDQAISGGAFNDALQFVDAAAKLAVTKPELKVLKSVIERAIRDLTPHMSMKRVESFVVGIVDNVMHSNDGCSSSNRQSHGSISELGHKNNALVLQKYNDVLGHVKAALDKFPTGRSSRIAGVATGGHAAAGATGALSWQPSYVASRMDSVEDLDFDLDRNSGAKFLLPTCCSIS